MCSLAVHQLHRPPTPEWHGSLFDHMKTSLLGLFSLSYNTIHVWHISRSKGRMVVVVTERAGWVDSKVTDNVARPAPPCSHSGQYTALCRSNLRHNRKILYLPFIMLMPNQNSDHWPSLTSWSLKHTVPRNYSKVCQQIKEVHKHPLLVEYWYSLINGIYLETAWSEKLSSKESRCLMRAFEGIRLLWHLTW